MLKKFYDIHFARQKFYKKNQTLHTVISLGLIVFWVFAFKSSILDANNIPSGSMQPTLKIGDFLFVNKMRYAFRLPFTDIILFRVDRPQRGDIVTFVPPGDSAELAGKTLVKRVVGLPGDSVEVRDDEVYINGKKYETKLLPTKVKNSILSDVDCGPVHPPIPGSDGQLPTIEDDADHDGCGHFRERNELYYETIPQGDSESLRHHILMNKSSHIRGAGCDNLSNPCPGSWTNPLPENTYLVMGDNRGNSSDGRKFGEIPLESIQGKVFMAYFSVNWHIDGEKVANPLKLLWETIFGERSGVTIRWDRAGQRIY